MKSIDCGEISLEFLSDLAGKISDGLKNSTGLTIFAIGEPNVLYNDFLNDNTYANLEEEGHRIIYAPFSEALWLLWDDYTNQNNTESDILLRRKVNKLRILLKYISQSLSGVNPFESEPEKIAEIADQAIGYYAGGFGRYRCAKILCDLNVDGIITSCSTHENTAISINILHKGLKTDNSKPVLNLTFDGNQNGNDKLKTETFIYYLNNEVTYGNR